MVTKEAKSVDSLIAKVHKELGNDPGIRIMRARDIPKYDRISTGSIALDFAIDGGIPSDKVGEIAGQENVGKSLLAYHMANNFLHRYPDRYVLYIDIEHRLDEAWMGRFVDNMDRVIVVRPDSMELATNTYTHFCKTGEISLAVLDSIGGAPTDASLERDARKGSYGGNAKAVSEFARRAQTMSGYNVATVGINQLRDDLNAMYAGQTSTPGGRAWKHACSWRVMLKKGEPVTAKVFGEEKPVKIGFEVKASVVKSSISAPFRTAKYNFYNTESDEYSFGIDTGREVLDLSILLGVVEQGGAWIRHPALPEGKIQGKEKFKNLVMSDPKIRDILVAEVMERLSEDNNVVGTMDDSEIPTDE